jgi:hypothetical protein
MYRNSKGANMKGLGLITALVACGMLLTGCADRSRNEKVIDGIRNLTLVDSPGISFETDGSEREGGTGMRLSHLRITGRLLSLDASGLPPDLAEEVAKRIRGYLVAEGCQLHGGGQSQGASPTDQVSSISYSLQGSEGRVEVYVIGRPSEYQGKKALGELMVTLDEAR